MTERIPGRFERALLPRLSEIAGELKSVNAKVGAVDARLTARVDAADEKLSTKIDETDKRLSENDGHLAEKVDDLDERLDIAQRVAVLEAQMSELRPKA